MKNSTKIKALALSSAFIIAAAGAAVIGTYALFSDDVTLTNHFVSGTLDVTLKRNYLEYTYCDSEGLQAIATDETVVDFSAPTEANVFGFGADDKMVPTDYRAVTMELSNSSTVAYDWWLEIKLPEGELDTQELEETSEGNPFAEQLLIQVDTDAESDGYEKEALLSDGLALGSASEAIGTVKVGSTSTFDVKVTFLDAGEDNNDAQDKTVDFDMIVHAIQHVATETDL